LGSSPDSIDVDMPPQKRRTDIYVVCSPHAHVGTTLTARLLLDFLLSHSGVALGFDTNPLSPSLASVFPRNVEIVDLASTRGQMALFDTLISGDKLPKVIDLWHVSYDVFFEHAGDFGFFEEARERNLKCMILLQMDPKARFANEMGKLAHRCLGADVVLVENDHVTASAVSPPLSAGMSQRPLFVPALSSDVRRLLEEPELLIPRFASMLVPEHSRALQSQVRETLLPVFQQFQIIEAASELGLAARSLLPRRTVPPT
jgi:hypothetical protein